jgi:hypothetical protein
MALAVGALGVFNPEQHQDRNPYLRANYFCTVVYRDASRLIPIAIRAFARMAALTVQRYGCWLTFAVAGGHYMAVWRREFIPFLG